MDRFATQTNDLVAVSSFTDHIAKIKDKTDTAHAPGRPGGRIGSLLSTIRDLIQNGLVQLPVINGTGSIIAANRCIAVTGYDRVTGRFKVGLANPVSGVRAIAVTHEALAANTGTSEVYWDFLLPASGLNTAGATLGDKVYLGALGVPSLTEANNATITQVIGYVDTKAASGQLRVKVQDPVGVPTADVVTKALYDAQSILISKADNSPEALTVAEARLVGRSTGGDVDDLDATAIRVIIKAANEAGGDELLAAESVGGDRLVDGQVGEVKLIPLGATDLLTCKREAIAVFEVGGGRAIGEHAFGPTLPDNAIVTRAWYEVVDGFTGGAGATLALGIATDHALGLKTATLLGDVSLVGAGYNGTLADGTVAAFTTKTTAARRFVATVGVDALTAGKLILHAEYSVGS